MPRVFSLALPLFLVAGIVFAHGDNDHLRGTVTQVAGHSITIQTADTPGKTLTVTFTDHTRFDKAGRAATVRELKVGDRVVVDVPKGKLEAQTIKIGTAALKRPSTQVETHKS